MEIDENHKVSSRRETMLTIVLTALAAGGFFLFMVLVSGFFFFYVGLVVGSITLLGLFHYLVWGRAMTQEVQEEQAREAAFLDAEWTEDAYGRRMPRKRF
jgi:fatty acid desaturase